MPILIIAGTNRPGSNALRVANALLRHYQAIKEPAEILSLDQMPPEIFNPTSYATKPDRFVAIQQRVLGASGLHVVSPEYNGSFPGVLKYFIDMLKFPESFERKPVAFVGEAAGVWGGLRAVEQLQMIFGYRNAHAYPERVFIPGVGAVFNEDGSIKDSSLDQRLAKQALGFSRFIKCIAGSVPA
jgi:NAD(P)H-dependent FMN reductase